ncbi:MAG: hypothetical protein U0531_20735 [Dehalococcoidia bacterium]
MWWDRRRPWAIFIPPLVAASLVLLFFWLTNRWANLENPIASQIAIFSALAGLGAGIAATRITNWTLLGIPCVLTVGVLLWASFAPRGTTEQIEFRQAMFVLTLLLAVTTVALNLPQVIRGRSQGN